MTTWQYAVGHRWQYDEEPSRMEFRFRESNEAKEAGFCGCACGVCKPEHPHLIDEGCICALFGCHCLDEEESAG